MNREIKFRVWDNVDYLSTPFTLKDVDTHKIQFTSDCILMQYTGLKDKNGKEIYEGDIVKCYDHPTNIETGIYAVEYKDSSFIAGLLLSDWGTAWVEIIGNIYENPELLTNN